MLICMYAENNILYKEHILILSNSPNDNRKQIN